MSDTPRTDAAVQQYLDEIGWGTYPDGLIALCRELERELHALRSSASNRADSPPICKSEGK